MRVLVIRHSEAVPAGSAPDAERALTPAGVTRFRAAARGLARRVPAPDALLTSPLLRARQTAALAAEAWGVEPEAERALVAGVDEIVDVLHRYPRDATIVLVGHEPTVSMLVATLADLASADAIGFEPGAAALLEVEALGPGGARLVWRLSPSAAARAQ
ncbi:MAG: histidine phosphatase family protein [Candidatus Rokubacteria bacterium]|nr:histidine phosphatase family protein [Candidatus Rokubacteria bacterium]